MMENGEKTWIVHDWDLDISSTFVRVVVRAENEQDALEEAYYSVFGELGCGFEALEAEQAPWLDGYEQLDDSDAVKEMRLYARQACGRAGEHAGGERQGLTMPIDTLADAMDWSQCDAAGDNGCRALDVASMALVDIAVSLRAMSGRPPVTDTPMQERMRAAMDKGEDPQSATEGMPYGMTSVRSYANAFKQACKPRTATDPSPPECGQHGETAGRRQRTSLRAWRGGIMGDRLVTFHRLACDWPGCKQTVQNDLYDGSATYEQAVRQWAYLPDEEYDDFADKEFLHDPATGKDYCADHWHYDYGKKWPHRVPGPDPRWQS